MRILHVLLARIVAGGGRPADILLHADICRCVLEEVVPHGRAVRKLHLKLPGVVVKTNLATELRGILGGLRVILGEILPPVVLDPSRRIPVNAGRTIAAARADDQVVAEGQVVFARLLHLVRSERILADVRPAGDKAVVRQHGGKRLGGKITPVPFVVTGELHALVADGGDRLERLREPNALLEDLARLAILESPVVGTNRIHLHADLRATATTGAAAGKRASLLTAATTGTAAGKHQRGRGRKGRTEE